MTIYTLKQIETPRLIIRPVQLGDEISLNKAINHSLKHLQRWQAWAKDPCIDATRSFIQRGVFAWLSQTIIDFPMVVIHKADQKIIAPVAIMIGAIFIRGFMKSATGATLIIKAKALLPNAPMP